MNTIHFSRHFTNPKLLLAIPALVLATVLISWQAVPLRTYSAKTTAALHVDQMPEFPGGQDALMKYLVDNISYPKAAKKAKAEGTVYVGFTVSTDGSVTKVNVKKAVHEALDAEAVRVVQSMPKWSPGKAHGKVVDVEMSLPIEFKLEGKK
jgi:TonB family protein